LKKTRNNAELRSMRIRETHLPQILLGMALLVALFWNLAHAAEVRWVQLDVNGTGTRAEIGLDRADDYKIIRLSNPARLAVDFPASRLGSRFAVPPGMGIVRSVRHGQPVPGTIRIVFDLAQSVAALEPRLERGLEGVWLVIEWPGDGPATRLPPRPPAPPPASNSIAAPEEEHDVVVWPLGDHIAVPMQSAPPPASGAPPARTGDEPPPAHPGPGIPSGALPQTTPAAPALPARGATGPPASPMLDPIAQIAAATQTGAAESMMQAVAATPVAVSMMAPPPHSSMDAVPGTAPQPHPPPAHPAPVPAATPAQAIPALRSLVIAIDPGHGGRDPGAIGPGGTHEKHVVLSIARELARQIDATPGMRAHLIRNSDVYVELPQRAHLAREAKADMFVSIHADAARDRQVHGASVYTLSTTGASSQHARWLADRENSADLIGDMPVTNNTLSSVLLDLVHSGHMKASQDAATHVLTGLSGVGKAHKSQVEYANFSVLRNADMPAMLVETGFISNAAEENRLKDPAYQRRLASAILNGINAFFRNQPPPGTLFAAHSKAHPDASGGLP